MGKPNDEIEQEADEGEPQDPKRSGRLTYLEVVKVHPSPDNPRHDLGDLSGLLASIKARGILQAVLARPLRTGGYELVCGHRRFACAQELGLTLVPASVRRMTDQEVVEARLTENTDRLDIHPLDEAVALKALVKTHRQAPKDIALKMGRPTQYVYQRLKLTELAPGPTRLFRSGELSMATALQVARIPNRELQGAAAKQIADGSIGAALAQDLIKRQYMLHLAMAPFDTSSETMFQKEGSCTKCPKRTGNQTELFAESARDGNLCTDPACFKGKADMSWRGLEARAAANDWVVLKANEAKAILAVKDHDTGEFLGTRYVDLNAQCREDPKARTWKQLIGKADVRTYLARDPQVGTVHYLVKRKEVLDAAVLNGHDHLKPPQEAQDEPSAPPEPQTPKLSPRRTPAEEAVIRAAVAWCRGNAAEEGITARYATLNTAVDALLPAQPEWGWR